MYRTVKTPCLEELQSVFEFEDVQTGTAVGVDLATVLQCLCVAEQARLVPPLDLAWASATITGPVARSANACLENTKESGR